MGEQPIKPPPNPFIPGFTGTVGIDLRGPDGKATNPPKFVPAPRPVVSTVGPDAGTQASIDNATNYAPRKLSAFEIAQFAQAAGFRGPALVTAVAVALAESGGQTDAQGPHIARPESWVFGDQALGLWQILPATAQSGGNGTTTGSAYDRTLDRSQTGPRDARRLFLPQFNARAAFSISKGGGNWRPWSTYAGGAYLKQVYEAQAAVNSLATSKGATTGATGALGSEPFVDVSWSDGVLLPVRLGGTADAADFGARVIGGSLDQSVKQPSELTLEIHDPTLAYLTTSKIKRGVRLQVNRQRFTITQVQVGDSGVGAQITVHAMPTGVVSLMHTDPPTVTGMAAGDYVALLVKAVGSTFLPYSGKGIPTSTEPTAPQEIATTAADDVLGVLNPYNPKPAPGKRTENAWEVIQRLNTANGSECWEDARGIYWGPATSSTFAQALYVSWRGQPAKSPTGAVRALSVPSITFTTPGRGRFARVSGSFTLAPADAGKVFLGQRVDLALGSLLVARPEVSTAEAAKAVTDIGLLRVVRVNRDLGHLEQPVTVEFESAVNLTGTDAPDPVSPIVTVPVPVLRKGTLNPYSSDVAVATAKRAVGGPCEIASCMHTVGTWNGWASSGWPRAIDGWNGTPASMRHPDDPNPPAGALAYWAGGSAGHVAECVGDGTVISTDAPAMGRVGVEPLGWFSAHWKNKRYLGWTEPYFPHGSR